MAQPPPQAKDASAALQSFATSWRAWLASGDVQGAMAATAAVLDGPDAVDVAPWRARALYADGVLAFRAGDMARSLRRNEELLRIARAGGDARGECDALTGLARIALRDGRYEDVVSLARSGRELARLAGDVDAEDGPRHLEAAGVRLLGDHARARELYLESLAAAESTHNAERVASEDHNLGWVELHLGDVDAAEMRFRRRDQSGVTNAYIDAWRDLSWAAIACRRGEAAEARRLFEAGLKALDGLGAVPDPDDALELAWLKTLMKGSAC